MTNHKLLEVNELKKYFQLEKGKTLKAVDRISFDIYKGEGIDLKEKSLALGLTFQHSSRTLNEDEVNVSVESVVSTLQTSFGATLRN